jgi:hypothetical protein
MVKLFVSNRFLVDTLGGCLLLLLVAIWQARASDLFSGASKVLTDITKAVNGARREQAELDAYTSQLKNKTREEELALQAKRDRQAFEIARLGTGKGQDPPSSKQTGSSSQGYNNPNQKSSGDSWQWNQNQSGSGKRDTRLNNWASGPVEILNPKSIGGGWSAGTLGTKNSPDRHNSGSRFGSSEFPDTRNNPGRMESAYNSYSQHGNPNSQARSYDNGVRSGFSGAPQNLGRANSWGTSEPVRGSRQQYPNGASNSYNSWGMR